MKLLAFLFALIPVSAIAGSPIVIERCALDRGAAGNAADVLVCSVTNRSDTPVASFGYSLRAADSDRTVPWVDLKNETLFISGGVEPGETIQVRMQMISLPDRADRDRLEFTVVPLVAIDANGEKINEFDATPNEALSDALTDALSFD